MIRRNFFTYLSLASSGLLLPSSKYPLIKNLKNKFNLNYAPHFGMFKNSAGSDLIDQLNFIADQGFTAFEDNGFKKRSISIQNKMAYTMDKRNLKMGVFVAHSLPWEKSSFNDKGNFERSRFLKEIKESIEFAKRINAKWMTVVPGKRDFRVKKSYQQAYTIDTLKYACEILEPHNLIMVLEPLNFRDHPGLFLSDSPQAFNICKAVNSKSCKILFDIYHQQIQEGNLIPNIEKCWSEIAYFQVGDNPGRNEPTTGEINYKNIFKYIYSKGFRGILGMEHGNSIKGKEGETALIEAYNIVDNFKN